MRTLGNHEPMTYAALERALTRLGFAKTELDEPAAIFFEHAPTQAVLIFPRGAPEQAVQPLDLITARRTVLEKGIASQPRYASLVAQANRSSINRPGIIRRRPLPKLTGYPRSG